MDIGLQATLAMILQQLADFFGMSIETITANAPEWLAKYGYYCVYGDILENLAIGALIAILIYCGMLFILAVMAEIKHSAPYIITGIITIIGYLIAAIVIPLIRCNSAPEIYGLMNLIELIKS